MIYEASYHCWGKEYPDIQPYTVSGRLEKGVLFIRALRGPVTSTLGGVDTEDLLI